MFAAINQLFAAICKLFQILDIFATSGVRMAEQHLAEAEHQRDMQAIDLAKRIKQAEASKAKAISA